MIYFAMRVKYGSMAGASQFSPEIAELICSQLAQGKSLRAICETDEIPVAASTVCFWIHREDIAPGFAEQYSRARRSQAELWADELVSISDTAKPEEYNVARLRVDTRKWILSKVLPKVYGDAMQLRHADADGNALKVEVTRVSPRKPRVIDVTPTPALPAPGTGPDDPDQG